MVLVSNDPNTYSNQSIVVSSIGCFESGGICSVDNVKEIVNISISQDFQ